MEIELVNVMAYSIPKHAVEFLRPMARADGHNKSDASVVRWAVIEFAKLRKAEGEQHKLDSL